MNSTIKEVVRIGSIKHLEMQDFAEKLVMLNYNSVNYSEEYYITYVGATYHVSQEMDKILFVLPAIFYSTEKLHKYILVNTNDFKYEMKDKLIELKANMHLVKVTKYEAYERDNLENRVLESTEKSRNCDMKPLLKATVRPFP